MEKGTAFLQNVTIYQLTHNIAKDFNLPPQFCENPKSCTLCLFICYVFNMVLIKWSYLYIMTYFSSVSSPNSIYQKEELVNKIFSIKSDLKLKVPVYCCYGNVSSVEEK